MRSERIASLSRYVIVNSLNSDTTASSQWLERTLDDSANRRIAISEGFLATDAILDLCINVTDGLVVNEKVIEKNLQEELPFMITENILMDKVKEGGNRQELHEEIRKLSLEASAHVKQEGLDNDLFKRMCESKILNISKDKQKEYLDASKYIGRALEQVSEFLTNDVKPVLEKHKDLLGIKVVITK
jgi:adenylosuccinate lyase